MAKYVIGKEVRGNKYYLYFPSHPVHYRNSRWEGLRCNATPFNRIIDAADIINSRLRTDALEPFFIANYETGTIIHYE